jgi:hypothetical protein
VFVAGADDGASSTRAGESLFAAEVMLDTAASGVAAPVCEAVQLNTFELSNALCARQPITQTTPAATGPIGPRSGMPTD